MAVLCKLNRGRLSLNIMLFPLLVLLVLFPKESCNKIFLIYIYVYLKIFKNGDYCNIAIICVNDQAWLIF